MHPLKIILSLLVITSTGKVKEMKEKEMKMYVSTQVVERQRVDDGDVNLERDKRTNLDHAERGHFIPFAEVLKKLG